MQQTRDEVMAAMGAFRQMTPPKTVNELKNNKFNELRNKLMEVQYLKFMRINDIVDKVLDFLFVKPRVMNDMSNLWARSSKDRAAIRDLMDAVQKEIDAMPMEAQLPDVPLKVPTGNMSTAPFTMPQGQVP